MTKGRTITLNKFMFDDSEYLKKVYSEAVNEGMFTQGTDYRHIVNHEFGHIIDKNNKELREKIIKVLRKDAESDNLTLEEYVLKNLSIYATQPNKIGEEYTELIAELEAARNGSSAVWADNIFRNAGVDL